MYFSKRTFKTNGRMITVTWWRARTYQWESERDTVQRSVSDKYSVMFTPECGAAADSPHYMLMLATLIVSPSRAVYNSSAAVKICIGPHSCSANCPHLWWLRTPGAAPWCARNARPGARAQCSPPWACWEIASICVQDVVNTAAALHSAKMMLKVLHCYPTLVTSYQKPWGQEMMALSWPGPCYGSWLQVITSASAIMECNKREQIAAHPGSPGSPGHGQSGGTLLWFCWRFYISISNSLSPTPRVM